MCKKLRVETPKFAFKAARFYFGWRLARAPSRLRPVCYCNSKGGRHQNGAGRTAHHARLCKRLAQNELVANK